MTNWYRVYNELLKHYNQVYATNDPPSLKTILEYLYLTKDLSLVEITTLTNREIMAPNTLRDHLVKLNIPIKERGGSNFTKEFPITLQDFEYNSAAELARKHKVDVGTIYRRKDVLLKAISKSDKPLHPQ